MLWFATKNPLTPWLPKAICIFIVAYALSPIDLIPDFIPVLGYVDEVILLPILIWAAIRLIPKSIQQESKNMAEHWLIQHRSKPKSYLGLFIIVVIWLAILLWGYRLFKA